MCCWETNRSQKDKGTTAAGQARLEGLCPPVPGRALAPREEHRQRQRHRQRQTDRDRQTDRHRQTDTDRQTRTHRHTDTRTHGHRDRLNQPQVNTSKDGPQARGWAIRHSRQVARCREPKQKLNLYSPVEAPRRCEGLGKQPVAPKQVISVAMVCKGLDCKSRASCEAGCDRFR